MNDLSDQAGTMRPMQPVFDIPNEPSRTMTRFADGTGHEFTLTGHTTVMGRVSVAAHSVPDWPLRNVGQVQDQHGWKIRAGVSVDRLPGGNASSGNIVGGNGFYLVAVSITDPDGRSENLVRAVREARVGHDHAANFSPVSLGALFDQTHALAHPAYAAPAARLWARAQRLHALNTHVEYTQLGLAQVPEGTPWWKHVFVLNWAAWPDLDTIHTWHDQVGSGADEALPYYEAGWTPQQAAPWMEHFILFPVASLLADHGWNPIQGLRLRAAGGHFFDAWWRDINECGDWVRLGLRPDLTVAAVRAGMTTTEAATLTVEDLATVTTMAALRTAAAAAHP